MVDPRPRLLTSMQVRGVAVANRLWASASCRDGAVDGAPQRWHTVHLGSFAVGGAGLVMAESVAVTPAGRPSEGCAGLWDDTLAGRWREVASTVSGGGAVPAMQLAHAGDLASGGLFWRTRELGLLARHFASAAVRAEQAGFAVVGIHAAHGSLLHEFLSPLTNVRGDELGGGFDHRVRLVEAVVDEVRSALAPTTGLMVQLTPADRMQGGWALDDSLRLGALLVERGVDLVDVASPGTDLQQRCVVGPAGSVDVMAGITRAATSGTRGSLSSPRELEGLLADGAADAVFAGAAFVRDRMLVERAGIDLGSGLDAVGLHLAVDRGPRDAEDLSRA